MRRSWGKEATLFQDRDKYDPGILNVPPFRKRRIPIMVSLSEKKTATVDIQKMLEAGMNLVKLRMLRNTTGERIQLVGKIDKAALTCANKWNLSYWPVGTCVELKTCIMRTGFAEINGEEVIDLEKIVLDEGSSLALTNNVELYDKCTKKSIFVDYVKLATDIKVGTEVSINYESVVLKCTEIVNDSSIKCLVTAGGSVNDLSMVCARGVVPTAEYFSKHDLRLMKFAVDYEVDMILINFVRHPSTIHKAKQYIEKAKRRPLIFSGICTTMCLQNLDDIIQESDGIILSREFLAYYLPSEDKFKMSQIQKYVSAKCHEAGKPWFLSGGVLQDTVLQGNVPGYEVSDVTNAILDGVDGFCLRDLYNPELIFQAIEIINTFCCSVEPLCNIRANFWRLTNEFKAPVNAAEAVAMAAVCLANHTESKVIILPTVTGKTCKMLLRMRPSCLIITVSTEENIIRMLKNYSCVMPLHLKDYSKNNFREEVEHRIDYAIQHTVRMGWLAPGDKYTTLHRWSMSSAYCDTVRSWKAIEIANDYCS